MFKKRKKMKINFFYFKVSIKQSNVRNTIFFSINVQKKSSHVVCPSVMLENIVHAIEKKIYSNTCNIKSAHGLI